MKRLGVQGKWHADALAMSGVEVPSLSAPATLASAKHTEVSGPVGTVPDRRAVGLFQSWRE